MALDLALTTRCDDLLAALAPYHSVLSECVDFPVMETDSPQRITWLKTRRNVRLSRKVFNAIELLALLAQVDWDVWQHEVCKIWGRFKVEDLNGGPARVCVDLDPTMDGRVEPVFEMIATSGQVHVQTTDIVRARKAAQRILEDRGGVLTEVPLRVSRRNTSTVNGFIYKVMQIVVSQRFVSELDGSTSCYPGLRIRFFRAHVSSIALSAPDLQYLAAIADAGVVIDDFGTIRPEVSAQFSALTVTSLWALFATGARDASRCTRGVKNVSLTKSLRASVVPVFYSAIATSPSVHSITIDPAIDEKTPKKYCQLVWPWIGFTLFCGAPNNMHRLQALTLNVNNFTVAHVEAIRDGISTVDPISSLFPRAVSLETEAISASRIMLNDPIKKNGADGVSVECPCVLTDLPVLKKAEEWISVLLPAWGQAWVHQDDVVAKHRWSTGPFPVKTIARIEFSNFRDESKNAVLALLRLVGAGVKHLVLKAEPLSSTSSSCEEWLVRVFDVCPRLETLELHHVPVNSLQFLLSSYESGKCRLSCFRKTGSTIGPVDESLRHLIFALGDRFHPAARYLSEFECRPVAIEMMSDPIMVATAVGMLENNQRLRDFEIGFLSSDRNARQYPACIEPLTAFDKKMISRISSPLDSRRRLAFLSVLTPREVGASRSVRERGNHAIQKLDAGVLSLIFEMTAYCDKRRVHVGMRGAFWM